MCYCKLSEGVINTPLIAKSHDFLTPKLLYSIDKEVCLIDRSKYRYSHVQANPSITDNRIQPVGPDKDKRQFNDISNG